MEKRRVDHKMMVHNIYCEDPHETDFFIELNGNIPSILRLDGPFLFNEYIHTLSKMFAGKIIVDWTYEHRANIINMVRIKFKEGYIILKNDRSYVPDNDVFTFKKNQQKYKDKNIGFVVTDAIDIFYNEYDGYPESMMIALRSIMLDDSAVHNKINILCTDPDEGLYTKELSMKATDLEFDLDLHYGDGFSKYHDLNIKRISGQTKGLILLHGDPGTGKSYYIRRLICDLIGSKKNVLYMSNNMVDMLGTPAFNNFLISWANKSESETKGILLVIEDAERVLVKREINQYGGDGVSNILNSSDGILNDFLNIQVLATFNSNIQNIDEAILRKKRALSIKEFNRLPRDHAQKVIDHYKIDHKATEDMSLADIFALQQDAEDEILFGGSNKSSNKIGF